MGRCSLYRLYTVLKLKHINFVCVIVRSLQVDNGRGKTFSTGWVKLWRRRGKKATRWTTGTRTDREFTASTSYVKFTCCIDSCPQDVDEFFQAARDQNLNLTGHSKNAAEVRPVAYLSCPPSVVLLSHDQIHTVLFNSLAEIPGCCANRAK